MKASFLSSERKQWLISFGITAVLFAMTFAICRPLFETNDDSAIVAAASGAVTGTPYAGNGFTSYLYGFLLAGLYRMCASIPWHAWILLFSLFLGISAVLKSILTLCHGSKQAVLGGLMLFGGLYAAVLMPYVCMLQFTTVSALAAAGGCALLLTRFHQQRGQTAHLIIGFLLLLVSFGLRSASFWVSIPLLLAFAVLNLVDSRGRGRKPFAWVVLIIVFFAGLALADQMLYQHLEEGWNDYVPFNDLLTSFLDYNNVGGLSEAAWKAAGWSPELTTMIRNWYMLDPKLNTENLSVLLDTAALTRPAANAVSVLRAAGSILLHYPMFGLVLAAFALLCCHALFCFCRSRQWTNCLRILGTGAYLLVFIGYFYGVLGRLPARAAFTAACPCYLLLMLTCLSVLKTPRKNRLFAAAAALVLVCGALTPALHSNQLLTLRWVDQPKDGARSFSADICEYAVSNPEQILVTGMPLDHDPFYVYGEQLPVNLVEWCHGMYHSPMYQKKLSVLGYSRFTTENLFDENVRILAAQRSMLNILQDYLLAEYGQVEIIAEQEYSTFGVYRLKAL